MPDDGAVSVVVPVYRTTLQLRELVARVHESLRSCKHEVILVDDGSPSKTWDVVSEISRSDPTVTGLRLGRNFGQHSAILAGLRAARYPITVTLDDDLQNPPEEIPTLLWALSCDVDVVYGSPIETGQSRWRRFGSFVVRKLILSTLGALSAANSSSFRAFRTSLREGFNGDLGPSVSMDALLSWSTDRFTSVSVRHEPRRVGKSHYSVRRLTRFAVDAITGYSTIPLQVATAVGLATMIFGLGVLGWVLGRLALTGESIPGFPFLVSIIVVFSGAQLAALGIVGEYLARMHFRVMQKPTFVIAESTVNRGENSQL